jgi:hypothetical protein
VAILGWNQEMRLRPEEPGAVGMECYGPHEASSVLALGAVLAALVVLGAWRRHEYVVPAAVVVTVTSTWITDAVTVDDPCVDNLGLLPIGALLLLVGATVAATVLAVITVALRDRRVSA